MCTGRALPQTHAKLKRRTSEFAMEKEQSTISYAVPIRSLDKHDIQRLIDIAQERLHEEKEEKVTHEERDTHEEKEICNWNHSLQGAFYALGGDYPDQECVERALGYAAKCLQEVEDMIYKLSHKDLGKCINDMKELSKEL